MSGTLKSCETRKMLLPFSYSVHHGAGICFRARRTCWMCVEHSALAAAAKLAVNSASARIGQSSGDVVHYISPWVVWVVYFSTIWTAWPSGSRDDDYLPKPASTTSS